ncbi:hypothetical protein NQ317_011259 [Molorchus minor]|uniref:Uncharacterized protein n=1 Tax=Molorchus minor TaxID=1323400 RepID=A0ABQ9JL67_9CUCU|nr:hypothetical protein NQ317_011259 [Molorchus minor]
MYRQIRINPEHTFLLNILWRDNTQEQFYPASGIAEVISENVGRVQSTHRHHHLFLYPLTDLMYLKWNWDPAHLANLKGQVQVLVEVFFTPSSSVTVSTPTYPEGNIPENIPRKITDNVTTIITVMANGQVERMNRSILTALMASTEEETRWDETEKSPYELFFGYRPRGINDAFLAAEICDDKRPDLETLRNEVSQRITSKQRFQKESYDKKHASPITFGVGQHVLVRKAKGSNDGQSRKLEPRYRPFVVTKVLDNDRYVVNELPGSKRSRKAYTGICPSERMKLFATSVSSSDSSSEN